MAEQPNPLISSKSSDSGLQVHLHPLVLLNISDHITRHSARQQKGPVVGALLGQQIGRTISLEHVFECLLTTSESGEVLLNHNWFGDRLQQLKDVHTQPQLDLMGWFTITTASGPTVAQLPLHRQILESYNETAIFLSFHASDLHKEDSSATGNLPLSIYESVYEEESSPDGDKPMHGDGQQPSMALKFRELPYSIETGEAEMISVDYVAKGAGNAGAIKEQKEQTPVQKKAQSNAKGKQGQEEATADETPALSPEDEDLIANLTTRLNAVKTLETRLHLIEAYLSSLSSSSSSSSSSFPSSRPQPEPQPQPSHTILRNISSLLSQLALLNPADTDTHHSRFAAESLAQVNDVELISLLGTLGQSTQQMREMGKKFAAVDVKRAQASAQGRVDEVMLQGRGV